jgi:hypothetical protein
MRTHPTVETVKVLWMVGSGLHAYNTYRKLRAATVIVESSSPTWGLPVLGAHVVICSITDCAVVGKKKFHSHSTVSSK